MNLEKTMKEYEIRRRAEKMAQEMLQTQGIHLAEENYNIRKAIEKSEDAPKSICGNGQEKILHILIEELISVKKTIRSLKKQNSKLKTKNVSLNKIIMEHQIVLDALVTETVNENCYGDSAENIARKIRKSFRKQRAIIEKHNQSILLGNR